MGFLSKIKNKMRKRVSKMPRRPGMISDMRFRGEMPRGGGFGNLREVIRRLKEQRDMGMPANPDGRVYAGGSPGLYAPGGRFNRGGRDRIMPNFGMEQMPISLGDRMIGKPQPIPERMPTDPSSYYKPTIFGQQMGDMDFSQMPEISPIDMSNLQMPTLPREISQMDLPQMPEGLPSMQDVQRMPQMRPGNMSPRMMMAGGDEVINRSPEQEIFSLKSQLKNLEEQLRMDRSYNDDQAVIDTSAQMAAIQNRIKELLQESGQTISNTDRAQLSGGGDFPDLTGDGQVTRADILKGRGVYAEGDEVMMQGNEIESMLSGMDSGEQEAMGELEQVAPEMEMIDQLVNMVVQMIQQGAGEQEVIGFLREQGLDDEDIGTILQLVAEMSETEEMAEDEIGNQLSELG